MTWTHFRKLQLFAMVPRQFLFIVPSFNYVLIEIIYRSATILRKTSPGFRQVDFGMMCHLLPIYFTCFGSMLQLGFIDNFVII